MTRVVKLKLEGTGEFLPDGSMRVIGVLQLQPDAPVQQVPDVPQNLRLVSLADDEVVLAWNSASGADSYELYRDDSELDDTATSPATDSTVAAGETYIYKVRAVNEAGSSAFSAELVVDVPAAELPVPGKPDLELVEAQFDFVMFSWDPLPNAVEYEVYDGETLLDTITETSFTHSSLSAESEHSYTVIASNASGDGDPSDALEVTTPQNLAPVWDALPDQILSIGQEVNLLLTSYCEDPEGRALTFADVDTSLPAGIAVSFDGQSLVGAPTGSGETTSTLRASDGEETADQTINWNVAATEDTTPPTTPTNVTASANGSTLTTTWTPSTDASGILYYEVQRSGNGGSSWAVRGTIAEPPFIETGVPNGTRIFRVRARDASPNQNWSEFSEVSNEVVTNVELPNPDTPTGFSASAQGSSVINLAWAAGPSGPTPTGYELDRSATGTGGWETIFSGLATSYSDTGRAESTQYFYRVRALNGAFASSYATADATTLPASGAAATWTRAPNTATATFDGNTTTHPGFTGPNRAVQPGDVIEFTAGAHGRVNFVNIGKDTAAYASNPVTVRNSSGGDVTFRSPTRMSGGFHSTIKNCFNVIFRGDTAASAPAHPLYASQKLGLRWMYSPATTPGGPKESQTSFIKFQAANATSKTSSFITMTNFEIDGGWHEVSGQSRQTNGIGVQTQDQSVSKANNPGMWQEGIKFLNCYVHHVEGEGFYFGPNYANGAIPLRDCEVGYVMTHMTGNDGINTKQWLAGTNSVHDFYVLRACAGDTQSGTPGCVSLISSGATVYNGIIEDGGQPVGAPAGNGVGLKQFVQNGPPGNSAMAPGYPTVSQLEVTVFNVAVNGMRLANGVSIGGQNNASLAKVLAKVSSVTSINNDDAGIQLNSAVLSGSFIKNCISVGNGGSNVSAGGGTASSNLTSGSANTLFVDPAVGTDEDPSAGNYRLTTAGKTAAEGCTGTRGTDYSTTDLYGVTRSATAASAHKGASE